MDGWRNASASAAISQVTSVSLSRPWASGLRGMRGNDWVKRAWSKQEKGEIDFKTDYLMKVT